MNYVELKQKQSQRLISFAWALEIIFCITGILIAISLSIVGLQDAELTNTEMIGIGMGFLPLFAIAIVELAKIPLVQGMLLAKSFLSKGIAALLLLLLCAMTFETMSTGLEQNIANREHTIKQNRLEVNELEQEIQLIDDKIMVLQDLKPEEIRLEEDANLKLSLSAIDGEIQNLKDRELEIRDSLKSTEIEELKRQLSGVEQAKSNETQFYKDQVAQLNNELLKLNEDEQFQLSKTIIGKNRLMDSFQARRDDIKLSMQDLKQTLDEKLVKLDRKITTINNKIIKLSSPDAETAALIANISSEISTLQSAKRDIIDDANERTNQRLDVAAAKEDQIIGLMSSKSLIKEDLAAKKNSLAKASEASFIHRLAAKIKGKNNIADLTEKDVSVIAMLFIFSIALVAAISGPLLAFLGTKNEIEESLVRKPVMKNALRKALLSFRKRMQKPKIIKEIKEVEVEVEVIKEVPVEKVVVNTVEVPKPFEVTKYVCVPVPKDASDLPQIEDMNPRDVTQLIQRGEVA